MNRLVRWLVVAGMLACCGASLPQPATFELFPANIALFQAINGTHHPWSDTFFTWFYYLGTGWVLIPVVLVLLLRKSGKVKYLLLAVAIETAITMVLKEICSQPRPFTLLTDVHNLQPFRDNSFPSGDTAMAATIACMLAWGSTRPRQALYAVYAVLVAYERVYLGAHFPLDVVAGLVIGGVASVPSIILMRRKKAVSPSANDNSPSPAAAGEGGRGVGVC
ncbi:MAG: phosphatase PAP2 family protein [Armatimonadota bacterium]